MIRKLKSGEYRLYSRKKNPKNNKRRNLGTFKTLAAAKKHEKAVQYFKHHREGDELLSVINDQRVGLQRSSMDLKLALGSGR